MYIVDALIPAILFELLKTIFCYVYDKLVQSRIPFTIKGWWCTCHRRLAMDGTKEYCTYELVWLDYRNGCIRMRLYQLINDGRKYIYKGVGFVRGNKMVISYEETNKNISNKVGTFNLRITNQLEHETAFIGDYHELDRDNKKSTNCEYKLKKCSIAKASWRWYTPRRLFEEMDKGIFKDECEYEM